MEKIVYFKEMIMPPNPFNNNSRIIDGYFIKFEDESELEIHFNNNDSYFSTVDCLNGLNRNSFKKNNTSKESIFKLNQLRQKLGLTSTNKGDIILVNSSFTTKQVII